ncbi:MAG: hypothetical protein SAJ37_08310 [Oscillatoria sp. PMC 1068.18]|nr:hypothetical protein [Oscillatoria sp. PMC 1076.18]MEC4988737.1 hypothetical protein [Oscillatoria sp. PMC 1068.18]
MTTISDCYFRQTSPREEQLYDHLLYCVQTESPKELLDRIRNLFIQGTDYTDSQIRSALLDIVNSKQAEQQFKYILNRCCHILVNRWQMQPHLQTAIPELVDLFTELPPPGFTSARGTRRIRSLVKDFTDSEQYLTLRRLAQVVNDKVGTNDNSNYQCVGSLINRYPYLYEYCLLSEDSSYEHQETVRQVQARIQHRFELDISQYVTYQVRRASYSKRRQTSEISSVKNPTLLSDRELGASLKQFVGKVENGKTHRDLAENFLTQSHQIPSFRVFKDELYDYLTSSINTKYGQRKFNDRLYNQLKNTLPQSDSQKPDEFLLLRTSSQLLNFLVVESPQRPNHYVFVDLITNIGVTATIVLLLKILLICRKVKPFLEKRFSILFNHYESSTQDGVPWLVKSLENLHLAFSIHFGNADLSCLQQIM